MATDFAATLKPLMQAVNITSYRALAEQAGVSRWQIQQLRRGNLEKMRVAALIQISAALKISLPALLHRFLPNTAVMNTSATGKCLPDTSLADTSLAETSAPPSPSDRSKLIHPPAPQPPAAPSNAQLKSDALQTLETWLIQWPTIAKRAAEKGEALPAAKILPFIRPIEQLMREWGVEPIAQVDEHIPYNPQYQQLTKGFANPGELVRVTHTGSRYEGKLLHRAKVEPLTRP